jgi:hypothetical protein
MKLTYDMYLSSELLLWNHIIKIDTRGQARKAGQEIHNYYTNNSSPQIGYKGKDSAKYRINNSSKSRNTGLLDLRHMHEHS